MKKDKIENLGAVLEENAVNAPVKDIAWEANSISTESKSHLEDDKGYGEAAVIRVFEYAINHETFKKHHPTNQELLNAHAKQIEITLWGDGLEVMPEVNPVIRVGKKKYRIFIGAKPVKGQILPYHVKPQTLTEITKPKK